MTGSSRESRIFVHLSRPLLATAIACGFLTTLPLVDGAMHKAAAQVSIRADFRTALDPYGRWQRIARWGDVWVPNDRPRGWRPYTVGRWVYSDDWGWYWASDQEEDAWGWVAYHYGRWVLDANLGWCWVPGDDWGPGFVQWRQGTQYVGWAPLPPDEEIAYEWRDQPDVWAFVRIRDFTAPRIETVILPEREHVNFIRDTVVVNRTVEFRDRRFAVNPGIAPAIVAAAVGRPIRSYDVRPRVFAGTARIPNAVEVRGDELRSPAFRQNFRQNFQQSLRQTGREITPAARVSQPQPLGRNEQGRLGSNPPRAASSAGPGATQGRGNPQPPLQPNAQGRNAQPPAQQPGTQGLGNRNQPQQGPLPQGQRQPPGRTQDLGRSNQPQPGAAPQGQRQPQGEPPRTQGLAPGREQPPRGPQNQQPQIRQPQQPPREPPRTQGLGPRNEPQQGPRPQPEQRQPQMQPRELPRTQGLAPRNEPPQAPRPQPEQRQPQMQPREQPRTQGLAPREQPRQQAPIEQRPPQQQGPRVQPQAPQPRAEGLGGQRGGPPPGAAPAQQGAPHPAGPPAQTEGRGGPRQRQ